MPLEQWPPPGAVPVDLTDLYPKLASQGLGYGPAFQGLVEAWREGSMLYGRAVLPTGSPQRPASTVSTPPCWTRRCTFWRPPGSATRKRSPETVLLPFAWSEVTLQRTGAVGAACAHGARCVRRCRSDCDGGPVRCEPSAGREGGRAPAAACHHGQVRQASRLASHELFRVEWQPVVLAEERCAITQWVMVGRMLGQALGVEAYGTVSALCAALDGGAAVPERVIVDAMPAADDDDEEVPRAAQACDGSGVAGASRAALGAASGGGTCGVRDALCRWDGA